MKIDLKREYPDADFSNIETYKQIVINKFKEFRLPLSKVKKTRLGDGLYIYGRYCSEQTRTARRLVKKISDHEYLYQRFKIKYYCNFISTENLKEFESFLITVIMENLTRKEFDKKRRDL